VIELEGMSHTGFDVKDIDRCIQFYTEVLGGKLEWRRETPKMKSIKLYVGNLGLSIHELKPDEVEAYKVPFAIHFAYRVPWEKADEAIAHIKAHEVDVDGPVGHGNEPQNVSWFFEDPDGHRLEIEAHYPTAEQALAVVEGRKTERQQDLGLYRGGDSMEAHRQGLVREGTQAI
jgi:catechol 2,3-dioxygenase-like lactoylglutathione lyase family enzyme